MFKSEYFECSCSSSEHTLRFMLWEGDEPEVYAHVFLAPDPFFARIWNAIKYVFGYRCRYGHFDEFIMQPEDAERMIDLMTRYKELYEQDKLAKKE